VEIGADGEALVFMAANRELGNTVRLAVKRVCGDSGWSNAFDSLENASEPHPGID
jgi:hypothetical protein